MSLEANVWSKLSSSWREIVNATVTWSFNNAGQAQADVALNPVLEGLRGSDIVHGGGFINYDGARVSWSTRFIVIGSSKGTGNPAPGGVTNWFDINMPTSGNVDVVGDTPRAATAGGIALNAWEALYYDLAAGSGAGASAFHVVNPFGGTANFTIPATWVLICGENGDTGVVKWCNGVQSATNFGKNFGWPDVEITRQFFGASGTWTPRARCRYAIFECIGGGGSGAGGTGNAANIIYGGGGDAGSYSRSVLDFGGFGSGAGQTVTIGAGGTAPAAGANNGNAGGDTSVGSFIIAKGGSGGLFGTTGQAGLGGAGGVAGTGQLALPGNAGDGGAVGGAAAIVLKGQGAAGPFGGRPQHVSNAAGPATITGPSAAANTGAGGSGGVAIASGGNYAGGNGGSGVVLITEF